MYWRETDESWRMLTEAQAKFRVGDEPYGEWEAWSGKERTGLRSNTNAWTDDDDDSEPWWVLAGEVAASNADVRVELEDGSYPPIFRLGRIWACEWRSVPQAAYVTIGAASCTLDLH